VNSHYQIVTLHSEDCLLHGVQSVAGKGLALHVHGTWGNFYENPFVFSLSEVYLRRGMRYASVNNPGHDGGSITERFDDSLVAISSWIEQLDQGEGSVILQGHSLGALKVLQMALRGLIPNRISGLVLLSAFDLVAFYGGAADSIAERREAVARQRDTRGGSSLVDESIFSVWPVSCDTFLAATVEGGPWDIFGSRSRSSDRLPKLDLPALFAYGSDDFAQTPDPDLVAQLTKQAMPNAEIALIRNAPHNFAGHEGELAEHLDRFVASVTR